MKLIFVITIVVAAAGWPLAAREKKGSPRQTLDAWIAEATGRPVESAGPAVARGSIYSPASQFSDLARDPRASQLDDIITVVISDSSSAVSKGTSSTSRKSSANYGVSALGGVTKAAGPLANLAGSTGAMQLDGQGSTTRQNTFTTTVSARVERVLPNGLLVINGNKNVTINSEHHVVTIRGIVRSADLSPGNTIASDRVANLEVSVRGKGLVGDAVRRPFILYRLLLGLLPL